jgi:hypothetical protein
MSARAELTVVVLEHVREPDGRCGCGDRWLPSHVTDAVIAAVRAMSVEDQAELIGGTVNTFEGLSYVAGRLAWSERKR